MSYLFFTLGGYPDTESNYYWFDSLDDVIAYCREPFTYNPVGYGEVLAFLYDGDRTPWLEHDQYPDYVVRESLEDSEDTDVSIEDA